MGLKSTFKRFFYLEDEEELDEQDGYTGNEADAHAAGPSADNVVNLASVKQQQAKVMIVEPDGYDDVQQIADHLKKRTAVVVNFGRISADESKRIIDFLGGTIYVIEGHMQRISGDTILCAPNNIDVDGVIADVSKKVTY